MSDREIIRVREVMKPHVDMVEGMITVKEALATMKHFETKTLVVNRRHENDEYGIVLMSDIAKQVLATDRAPERINVYEVMTKPVICVDPDMDIRYCARMFDKFGLTRAPVMKDRKIIGIVSFTDMVLHGLIEQD